MKSLIPGVAVAALSLGAILPNIGQQAAESNVQQKLVSAPLGELAGRSLDDGAMESVLPAADAPTADVVADEPLMTFEGYEQDWQNGNDELIKRVVAEFNAEHGWDEDHEHHLDPNIVKAWALQESGSHREIFTSGDMMQMNNAGDWAPEKERFGVSKGEQLDPEKSLRTALEWAYMKGEETRAVAGASVLDGWYQATRGDEVVDGYMSRFVGWDRALTRYNGGGVPDYLGDIERRMAAQA